MDITEFYTIETPPSSSTSKDSIDESLLLSSFQTKNKFKLLTPNIKQKSIICSTSKSTLSTNPISIKNDEVTFYKIYISSYHH
jgi:hypothetical protein